MGEQVVPKEVPFDEMFDRLVKNKIVNTRTDLAKLLCIGRAAVSYIAQKRGTTPPEWERRFEDAGYSWRWVATGEGPIYNNVSIMAQGKLVVAKRIMSGPDGKPIVSERDVDMPMHTQYLRSIGFMSDDDPVYFVVQGDSMAPTFVQGDICMIDRGVRNIDASQYFLVRYSNGIMGVRKIVILGDRIEVRCDNPDYPPTPYDQQNIEIIGRVAVVIKKM